MSETEKQASEPVSKCCGAPMSVATGDDLGSRSGAATNWYECTKCGKPTDCADHPNTGARECAEQPSEKPYYLNLHEAFGVTHEDERKIADAAHTFQTICKMYQLPLELIYMGVTRQQLSLDSAISKAVAAARDAAILECAEILSKRAKEVEYAIEGETRQLELLVTERAIRSMMSKKEGERHEGN